MAHLADTIAAGYLDIEGAYDNIGRNLLWDTLEQGGVDAECVELLGKSTKITRYKRRGKAEQARNQFISTEG